MTLRDTLVAKKVELDEARKALSREHGDGIEEGVVGIQYDQNARDFLFLNEFLGFLDRARDKAEDLRRVALRALREKPDAEMQARVDGANRTLELLDLIEGSQPEPSTSPAP